MGRLDTVRNVIPEYAQGVLKDRLGYFQNRAIFKKVGIVSDRVTIPIGEAKALNLNTGNLVQGAILSANQRDVYTFKNREVSKAPASQTEGGFSFSLSEDIIAQLPDREPKNLYPAQFIVSTQSRLPDVNITSNWWDATWQNGIRPGDRFNMFNAVLWKRQPVRMNNGNIKVTIEANEAQYHNIEEGDQLTIAGTPVNASRISNITDSTLPETVQVTDSGSDSLTFVIPQGLFDITTDLSEVHQWMGKKV